MTSPFTPTDPPPQPSLPAGLRPDFRDEAIAQAKGWRPVTTYFSTQAESALALRCLRSLKGEGPGQFNQRVEVRIVADNGRLQRVCFARRVEELLGRCDQHAAEDDVEQ
jgi:hypothetical protein